VLTVKKSLAVSPSSQPANCKLATPDEVLLGALLADFDSLEWLAARMGPKPPFDGPESAAAESAVNRQHNGSREAASVGLERRGSATAVSFQPRPRPSRPRRAPFSAGSRRRGTGCAAFWGEGGSGATRRIGEGSGCV